MDFQQIAERQAWERTASPAEITARRLREAAEITDRTPVCVAGFHDGYAFLSNFGPGSGWYDGEEYPSREHAYNAAKTLDLDQRIRVRSAGTANQAKRAGRTVTLRPDWDARVRYEVMYEVVREHFERDEHHRIQLLRTQDDLLVERTGKQRQDGTWIWHDQTWGWCSCPRHRSSPGANRLGLTLMQVRSELRGDAPDRWVKVMVTGHRPQHIKGDRRDWVREQLERVAAKLIAEHGMRVAIHGGAIGTDLGWAIAASKAGVDALWSYLPFPQQPDRWDDFMQERWRHVTALREAGGLSTRTEFLAEEFSKAGLHARNGWMIRDCDAVVAVHDPDKITGGTAEALRKIGASKPIIHIDPQNRTVKIRNRPRPATSSTGGRATVVHIREPHDVVIGRPSKWGNPFVIGRDGDRATVIAKYRQWIATQPELLADLPELRGKRLACYCSPEPCHGDVLAALANGQPL